MINFKKNDVKKIFLFFGELPRMMAGHFFRVVFMLLLFNVLIGALVFYQYNFVIQNKIVDASPEVLKFKEDIYQKILIILAEREKRFNESYGKIYLNPFSALPEKLTE